MFEKLFKNLFDLNPTIIQLPITYIGNKYLKETSERKYNYNVPYNRYLMDRLQSDYDNKLKKQFENEKKHLTYLCLSETPLKLKNPYIYKWLKLNAKETV
jgi:hypothetical protein